ncbi:hypothetical protein POMI540_4052 [Schizosaccharomyces pombe]|uniref:Uncharacterized protein C736.02 n=1 Tax=Schizosaccharomyces pombe (strain 972 / ATCC 24843) TaxID=284812 RepID=YJC2_SCHPO|nr:uncharacterized protein SPCC736.02 [Schizosaccharomyces pombe]O74951.1 RecName: Full=Uncharacterized protein C736.02 [Schizosaccharomyces pombe 972h-]CAA19266.1 sequence orphan [Schizosaccharomyces pombe]|eukprot:NP_587773.1 uncharacterized protein SPCC736.02 [Schizosaccharomyces pombe]
MGKKRKQTIKNDYNEKITKRKVKNNLTDGKARALTVFESLPLEVLRLIFLLSNNSNLAVTSRSLRHRLSLRNNTPIFMPIDFTLSMVPKSIILSIQRGLLRRYFTLQILTKIDELVISGFVKKSPNEDIKDGRVIHAGHEGFIPKRILFLPNAEDFIAELEHRNFLFKASSLRNGFLLALKQRNIPVIRQVGKIVTERLISIPDDEVEFCFLTWFEYTMEQNSVELLDIVFGFWNNIIEKRFSKSFIDSYLTRLVDIAISKNVTEIMYYLIEKGAIPQLPNLLKLF